jgi:hypothetical protein
MFSAILQAVVMKGLHVFLMCLALSLTTSGEAQTACLIEDEEEYAVFAAVLFPYPPEVPDGMTDELQQKAHIASKTIRLSGFHGNHYTMEDESSNGRIERDSDQAMIADYNKKNSRPCRIDGAQLLRRVPAGKHVTIVSAEEVRKIFSEGFGKGTGWKTFRQEYPFASGLAYLSRPGFDETRSKAVIGASHNADYRMGVGYRVFLEKSAKTGKWIIVGAYMTRIS